jgi:hypothetical protein
MTWKHENCLVEIFRAFLVVSIELALHFDFQPLGINPVGRQIKELLGIGT